MAQTQTLRLRGYREFLRACDHAGKDTKREVRAAFRLVGRSVLTDWSRRLAPIDTRSALGLKTRVRARGVSVEQSIRRTTGLHPEYGALQMRLGLRAATSKQHETERAMEDAIDHVADHFDRGA